jgi:hypothetical protein
VAERKPKPRSRATPKTRAKTAASNGTIPHGPAYDKEVAVAYRRLAVNDDARRLLASARESDRFVLPSAGSTLADDLAVEASPVRWRVEQLHSSGGNTLLVAQHKAGKTTLALNLARSLADGVPFLGHFEVEPLTGGRVAFFNYELHADMFREWTRDIEVEHPERIAPPLHLRGHRLPFWEDRERERVANWLRRNKVEVLIVDPAARAWSGLVDNENDNTQVGRFTDALDELKEAAGVADLVLATHTGRARAEENEERSRGATRLEDWMDAGWYLTKDAEGVRSLRAMGRDVEVEAITLRYNSITRRLRTSGQTRREHRTERGVRAAVEALHAIEQAGGEVPTTSALANAIQGDRNKRNGWITAAETAGLIERESVGKALVCRLTPKGKRLLKPKRMRVKKAQES